MAQIIAWNDISFALGGASVNAVEGIEITGSCETEDSESGGEKFVKRKNGKPYSIEMKAILDARLGVNVQSMATKMTEAARCSTTGYFYTGSAKLFPCKFMMVEASVGDIIMNSAGTWISCEVKLKLKQSTKYDGTTSTPSSSSSGGGSSSSSSKKSSTKSSSTKKTSSSSDVDVVSMAAPSTSKSSTTTTRLSMTGVSAKSIAAVAASRNAVNSAKKTSSSSTTKSTTVSKK